MNYKNLITKTSLELKNLYDAYSLDLIFSKQYMLILTDPVFGTLKGSLEQILNFEKIYSFLLCGKQKSNSPYQLFSAVKDKRILGKQDITINYLKKFLDFPVKNLNLMIKDYPGF